MRPVEVIDGLKEVRNCLHTRLQHFIGECDAVEKQWASLEGVGGHGDYARVLVGRLKNHLRAISRYCDDVVEQIDAMMAEPSDRNDAHANKAAPAPSGIDQASVRQHKEACKRCGCRQVFKQNGACIGCGASRQQRL